MVADASAAPSPAPSNATRGLFQPQWLLLKTVAKRGTVRGSLLKGGSAAATATHERSEASESQRRSAHQAAEAAEAGTLGWPQPRLRNCTLHFIRPLLHLFSFLPGDDATMLRHWLRHYDSLGIDPARVRFARVNASGAEARAAWASSAAVLRHFGIDEASQVVVAPSETYSDALKLAAVNAWLKTLPLDAWVTFPDADELFSFPCGTAEVVRRGGADRFCAQLVDRLAASGRIEPLRPWPDVSVQFPVECQLRQLLSEEGRGTFFTSKVVLFRVREKGGRRLTFRTPHNLVGDVAMKASCARGPSIAHYTLTDASRRLTVRKAAWEAAANRDPQRARQIACTMREPASNDCVDYKSILAFMDAQARRPNRSLAPLCMTSLVGATGSRYDLAALARLSDAATRVLVS